MLQGLPFLASVVDICPVKRFLVPSVRAKATPSTKVRLALACHCCGGNKSVRMIFLSSIILTPAFLCYNGEVNLPTSFACQNLVWISRSIRWKIKPMPACVFPCCTRDYVFGGGASLYSPPLQPPIYTLRAVCIFSMDML